MSSYDDFEREVLAHQQQLLSELVTTSPSRVRTRSRGHAVARVLRRVADRLDPEASRELGHGREETIAERNGSQLA